MKIEIYKENQEEVVRLRLMISDNRGENEPVLCLVDGNGDPLFDSDLLCIAQKNGKIQIVTIPKTDPKLPVNMDEDGYIIVEKESF